MSIRTKPSTPAYAAGWDRVFGTKKRKPVLTPAPLGVVQVPRETRGMGVTEADYPGYQEYLRTPLRN